MASWTYDEEQLTDQANQIKDVVLNALLSCGAITEENYKFFLENYAVLQKKKGFWGKLLEKKLKKDLTYEQYPNSSYFWVVVKLIEHEK